MRKLVSILLSVLLLTALVIPAAAEEVTTDSFALTASPDKVEVGKTVTITISVVDKVTCTAFGVILDDDVVVGDASALEGPGEPETKALSEVFEVTDVKNTVTNMTFVGSYKPGDVDPDKIDGFLTQGVGVAGMNVGNYDPDNMSEEDIKNPPVIQNVDLTGNVGTVTLKAKTAGTYTITASALVIPAAEGVEYTVTPVTIEVEEASGGGDEDILWGDADGDGCVDSWDATLIARYDVGKIKEETLNLSACDVDGDGCVDSWDATLIARFDVGKISKFPVEK